MKTLGPKMLLGREFFKAYMFVQGTRPMGDQTMNSVDLFHIFEQANYHSFREPFEYSGFGRDDYSMVRIANDDGSYRLGPGVCNEAILEDAGLVASDSVEQADCFLVLRAIADNAPAAIEVMKHSMQPVTPLATPEELIEDFGIDQVSRAVESSLSRSIVDPIQERVDARILYCADSLKSEICRSLTRVYSSEGISIALNVGSQTDLLTPQFRESVQSKLFLDRPVSM